MPETGLRLGEPELSAAVSAGVITPEQAAALRTLAVTAAAAGTQADEEHFRLLGGFNDVLVSIGLVLLVGALFTAGSLGFGAGALPLLAVAVSWGLAEFFTRRLRLALPSIILAGMFAGAVLMLALLFAPEPPLHRAALLAAVFTGAALLHFRRFEVPVDVTFAATGSACLAVALAAMAMPQMIGPLLPGLLLLAGCAIFLLAMHYDLADRLRLTRRADIAFWLHLAAAPLIVHSLIAGLFGSSRVHGMLAYSLLPQAGGLLPGLGESAQAIIILVIVLVLLAVALVVDRRALLVSGLTYAGFALWVLFRGLARQHGGALPLSLFALAGAILMVSAGWQVLRAAIVPRLPLGSLTDRLPPLRGAGSFPK